MRIQILSDRHLEFHWDNRRTTIIPIAMAHIRTGSILTP